MAAVFTPDPSNSLGQGSHLHNIPGKIDAGCIVAENRRTPGRWPLPPSTASTISLS